MAINTATCPVCGFNPNDCRCGYDPNMTYTTSGSTDQEPKAQRCPVCMGGGMLTNITSTAQYDKCHGCEGKGWVIV